MIEELPARAQYSLDTNCLVTAWHENYPPSVDVFAPVWGHLSDLIDNGVVVATNVVWKELNKKDDEVLAWCKERMHMFLNLIPELGEVVTEIEREYPKILKGQRNEADPFVIGLAEIGDPKLVVVTQERPGSGSENRPNIPFICGARGIKHCNFLQMLRDTGL